MTPADFHARLATAAAAPAPEAGRVVLQLAFFRELGELLHRADQHLLAGEPVDLDQLAQVLAVHLRAHLAVIHPSPVQPDDELGAARTAYIATLDASRRGDPEARRAAGLIKV